MAMSCTTRWNLNCARSDAWNQLLQVGSPSAAQAAAPGFLLIERGVHVHGVDLAQRPHRGAIADH